MNTIYLYFTISTGLIALAFAYYKSVWINKQEAGNTRMKEIGAAIREGAMAFLSR